MSTQKARVQMFTETLFMIAKQWNQSKYSLANEWKNKIWYIHTVEYYLTTKWNKY